MDDNKPIIIPNKFIKGNNSTDYEKLIESEKEALFIFNDNVEHHKTTKKGNNNAVVRPFNKYRTDRQPPRSAGVSTGEISGDASTSFNDLNKKIKVEGKDITIKDYIDSEIKEITELIKKYNYKKIYFSATCNQGKCLLDTKNFKPSGEVKEYITKKILELGRIDESKIQKKPPTTSSGQDYETYKKMKEELDLFKQLGIVLKDTDIKILLDKKIQELNSLK